MEKFEVQLESFVGPLDVLLHLIQKLEVDIYDIPIFEVTKQYMAIIHAMNVMELEVAGEYLVMASTLMAIKSKMLLPTEEYLGEEVDELTDENGADPREALVEQLLNYRKFKFAATLLKEKQEEREQFFTKAPMNVEPYKEEQHVPEIQYNTIDLFLAFHQMLEKKKMHKPRETMIESETETIEERMDQILHQITSKIHHGHKQGIAFEEFFEDNVTKTEIVTTFMALLELMKKKQVIIEQENNYAPIVLYSAVENRKEMKGGA